MNDQLKNACGFWKMTSIRHQKSDGTWEAEKIIGGTTVITESGFINAYTRTTEIDFGYSGTYTVNGNVASVQVEVCSFPNLEGTTLLRTVLETTPEYLKTEMTDEATGRLYQMEFKLLTRTFVKS